MSSGDVILYDAGHGAQMQLRAVDGTVWLTLSEIAELYGTTSQNIGQLVRRVLAGGEVDEATTKRDFVVRSEGARQVSRQVTFHNLDMVLAVGYRATSERAIRFRQWATSVLRDYLVKGFAMDDQKLKAVDGSDFFEELLGRIRSIRASEKRFYQKVREMYATAIDYDPTSPTSQVFFATVQNKMLWAVTGHTAAEIVQLRSDPAVLNMGLTSWSGSVVRKGDVVTAKNYLASEEIHELDRIVTMYLDYAEDQAQRRQSMTMADWAGKLDAFLSFNERDLLTHAGKVQASVAQALAEERFAEFDSARMQQAVREEDRADLDSLRAIERKLEGGK
jgi:hypothetical protein